MHIQTCTKYLILYMCHFSNFNFGNKKQGHYCRNEKLEKMNNSISRGDILFEFRTERKEKIILYCGYPLYFCFYKAIRGHSMFLSAKEANISPNQYW